MNLFENLLNMQESNKSIDDLIELAGGINYIDEIFHDTINEYKGIENDIDEVADFTYDKIKDNLSLDEWTNVLEYLYYNSSKLSESISNDKLWNKFNSHYNGFIPLKDLTNYFSLDQFGEFIQWCRKEADLDYDYEKRYSDWSEIYQEIYDIWFSEDVESISVENVFNFFTTSDLEEFWNWVEREYDLVEDDLEESIKLEKLSIGNKLQTVFDNFDSNIKLVGFMLQYIDEDTIEKMYKDIVGDLEEATSGIGAGAYTVKAIDMIPGGLKKVKESLYDEYLERVMDEKSNVELVNLLHEIKDNTELKSEDKKKLEDEIKTKVRTIKTEAITEFYGKEWTDEDIQKLITFTKENPEVVGHIDPSEYADPFNYNGKIYYTVGEGKEIIFDGKQCVVFLTVDEELNRYLSYFEVSYADEGDGESGPQELTMTFASDAPYKVVEV